MKNKIINLLKKIKKILGTFLWVFLILLSIESFTFKIPYGIVVGFMLLLISFLFFPWQNKLFLKWNIKLSKLNKLFIFILCINICAFSIKITEKSYFKCILPIILMILTWILMIIYKKIRKVKN